MFRFSRPLSVCLLAALLPACGAGGGGPTLQNALDPNAPSLGDDESPYIDEAVGSGGSIRTTGGRGTAANGGNGGAITISNAAGSNTRIRNLGSVITEFVVPAGLPDLGSNPLTVSADTALTVGAGLAQNSGTLLGDDGFSAATGLLVEAGVTLTLGPNYPAGGANTLALVSFSRGIVIHGAVETLTADGSTVNAAELQMFCHGFRLTSTGTVSTRGVDAPGLTGGNGARFAVESFESATIIEGDIDASGGHGAVGGTANIIQFQPQTSSVYVTGTLTASGGDGSAGVGGAGGILWFLPSHVAGSVTGGGAFVNGVLTARGGSGTTGGGVGGWLEMNYQPHDGPMLFSGSVDVSGGSATTSGNGGAAHAGAAVQIAARGGSVFVSGTITARGGDGAGPGNGGIGGNVLLNSSQWGTVAGGPDQPFGNGIFVSATIDSSGGSGAAGGNGGVVEIRSLASTNGFVLRPLELPVWAVGYDSFDLSGGQGAVQGGTGGAMNMTVAPQRDAGGEWWAGSLWNEVDVASRGGEGGTGAGGSGGTARVLLDLAFTGAPPEAAAAPFYDRRIVNDGAFDLSGGESGIGAGGAGGGFFLRDTFHVENRGAVVTSGGSTGGVTGGNAGTIRISSDGVTLNQAALTGLGGDAAMVGGNAAASITIDGRTAVHAGTIAASGGDGAISGGWGSGVEISSWDGVILSLVSGTVTVLGGTGPPPVLTGWVRVDGILRALTAGSITF